MSERLTEVEVQSGYQKGRISIIQATRTAAVNALINAGFATVRDTIFDVAHQTGAMRVAYARSIEKIAFRLTIAKSKITVRGSDMLRLMETVGKATADYLPHHIRQSQEFNPKFIAGYKDPSTPGTKPINLNETMIAYHRNALNQLKKELKKMGVEVK